MVTFHPLAISKIEKTTEDCTVVTFDISEEKQSMFAFTQGQYLTLRAKIGSEEVRRSYSLCTSPFEKKWSVAIKKVQGGLFSTYANNTLHVGDVLEALQPSGNFYIPLDASKRGNYVVFAAGSGITPTLSIIKAHLEVERESTFTLFYLNSTSRTIILKEEIEAVKNQYVGRFRVFHILSREARDIEFLNGRFTPEKIQYLAKTVFDIERTDHAFICGPKDMIFMIRDELQRLGMPKKHIHFELFFTGETGHERSNHDGRTQKSAKDIELIVIDGGKEFKVGMEDHDSILDSALTAGVDLPYACKGGVCSTCKCKVLEGKVKMKVNYALEAEEVKNNYVLSCQAVPMTKKVIVDFDV